MNVSKVGRRGQISIPSHVRQEMGLQEGDRIAFIRRGDEVILQPLKGTLLNMRGNIPVEGPQDFAVIREQMFAQRRYRVDRDD